ncbi:MAG: hypothetical protein USCAAHI_01787 [Beijerinckiaceae bacterium]|nr:MAG: hypothetical protein USCAAHI_01787 [Beijerinckiaceae bacterium]
MSKSVRKPWRLSNLDSASEVLKRGREAGWTFPMATGREEAEFYAREA